ncbi:MAG: DUF362 domain-containing protein [Phycisphaerae bacterium]|nr:DUF362 domain-containing protein [Phycisphaerae bacterium]
MLGTGFAQDRKRIWRRYPWLIWLLPVAGLVSLIWFLIRVVPKPSRATYPCQRFAAPLASGFIIWITGLIGSALAYRKARRLIGRSRYVVGGICAAFAVTTIWVCLSVTGGRAAQAAAPHPVNSPTGAGKGVFPGRVVWIHDANATDWEGPGMGDGHWWQSSHTDQAVVDSMVRDGVGALAGEGDVFKAWDLLFRNFNEQRDKGDVGYQAGEKIMIKVNFVQMIATGGNRDYDFSDNRPDYPICSPQIMHSLLDHLVNIVGVAQSDITIGDPICLWCNEFYNMIHPDFPEVRYVDYAGYYNRTKMQKSSVPFYWSTSRAAGKSQDYMLKSYADAEYLINLASLKGHYNVAGITLCAKNHYGSLRAPTAGGYYNMHSDCAFTVSQSGRYRNMVDLMGHEDLGGKTLLCMIDGLYAGKHALGYPNNLSRKWQMSPFNNDWPSSIFFSQDQVAVDSVGFDFLVAEWPEGNGPAHEGADDYLHEAAQADSPPSGTAYDPEKDGSRLGSLGVHEHWNNATDKQYSRNLGAGNGIELVTQNQLWASADGPIRNMTIGRRYDFIQYAINDARDGDEIVVPEQVYAESINLRGKNVTVRSSDPNDPLSVAATVINGVQGGPVVTLQGSEDASCVLSGLTITGGELGVFCSGASPTISNCVITDNAGAGVRLWNASGATIIGSTIADNGGDGVELSLGRGITSTVTMRNCTIVGNSGNGVYSGVQHIISCIIYYNDTDAVAGTISSVTYSDVQGGWPGEGNIDCDPCFADPCNGDYHLKSEYGRWNPNSQSWVLDDVTSLCIDGGDPASEWRAELWPHGECINMGRYGGTPEASMSRSPAGNAADLDLDNDVDFRDFDDFVDKWRAEEIFLREDIDRNGLVDFFDLKMFVDEWLWRE